MVCVMIFPAIIWDRVKITYIGTADANVRCNINVKAKVLPPAITTRSTSRRIKFGIRYRANLRS